MPIKSINGEAIMLDPTANAGSITADMLVDSGAVYSGYYAYVGMSRYLKQLSGSFSTITIGRWINLNTGATLSNPKRAYSGSLNVTTSGRRAVTLTDSTYRFQAVAYNASVQTQANFLGRLSLGWMTAGELLYLPEKLNGTSIVAIVLLFARTDDADLTSDDGDAIKAATVFYRSTDDELASSGVPADGKETGDAIAAVQAYAESAVSRIEGEIADSQLSYRTDDTVTMVSTTAGVIALYDALVTAHPSYVTKSVLTHGSLSVPEYTFTTKTSYNTSGNRTRDAAITKPVLLICAGVHGYERSSVMSLYTVCKALCEDRFIESNVSERYTIKVIPIVCSSGYDANTRTNANGVNINRNFASSSWEQTPTGNDYSGPSAGSEDETQVVQAWIDANTSAALYVDWHNSNYTNEVSCSLMVTTGSAARPTKLAYLTAIDTVIPYWREEREIASTNIYAYTGKSTATGSSVSYATDRGLRAMTLETSWDVASSGQHSAFTIGVGAEALGNMLLGMGDLLALT